MAVALGLATPGLFGGGQTPVVKTGLATPRFAEKRKAEEPGKGEDPMATSSSSAPATAEAAAALTEPRVLKQLPPPPTAMSELGGRKQEEQEESARRAKAMRSEEAAFHGARRPGNDLSEEESSTKRRGVGEFNVDEITVMPHGDTNVWDEIEGIVELDLNDWGPKKADGLETVDDEMQVMEFDQEEIQKMDEKAEEEEIERLKAMAALTELQPHEENDYSDITTKMVITWKKREEKGGWFRRARLVAHSTGNH